MGNPRSLSIGGLDLHVPRHALRKLCSTALILADVDLSLLRLHLVNSGFAT